MPTPAFKIPPQIVEKYESIFEELLNKLGSKVDDDFKRLLDRSVSPAPQAKTWPERAVPVPNISGVTLSAEDGTRVIKLSDAIQAVYVVLLNMPDWGPREDVPHTITEFFKWFDDFGNGVLRGGNSVENQITRIAKLMKLKVLSQKRKRVLMTKKGYFRQ